MECRETPFWPSQEIRLEVRRAYGFSVHVPGFSPPRLSVIIRNRRLTPDFAARGYTHLVHDIFVDPFE